MFWELLLGYNTRSPFEKGGRGIYSVTDTPANLEIIVPG